VVSNQPPTAVMSATPSTGAVPLTVTFDGSGRPIPTERCRPGHGRSGTAAPARGL
jgi:hypothetical protein